MSELSGASIHSNKSLVVKIPESNVVEVSYPEKSGSDVTISTPDKTSIQKKAVVRHRSFSSTGDEVFNTKKQSRKRILRFVGSSRQSLFETTTKKRTMNDIRDRIAFDSGPSTSSTLNFTTPRISTITAPRIDTSTSENKCKFYFNSNNYWVFY